MENCQLILNSNSLCVICLSEVKVKASKNDLFPLHHLTTKINSNLGSVFKDVTVPWAPHAVLDRLEILADVCEGCFDLCEELLYKFQDDVERENCIKALLDKMEKVGMEDKYSNCGSPSTVFYLGIVDRLRKDIIEKLGLKTDLGEMSKQSTTETSAEPHGIPNLLNIPDVPISQICSYLSLKDIKACSIVSKALRHLVFPLLINSSFIRFKNPDQIPAMIDFIKAISNNLKKDVSLSLESEPFDNFSDDSGSENSDSESLETSSDDSHSTNKSESPDDGDLPSGTRSTLLQLFRECGRHINNLKLSYVYHNLTCFSLDHEIVNGLRDNKCIPDLGVGNELFPNVKKLEIDNYNLMDINCYMDEELGVQCREDATNAFLAFIKALLHNSPNLREVKLFDYNDKPVAPSLFKLIAESGLRICILEIEEATITDDFLTHLQLLNLTKVILVGYFDLKDSQSLPKFLESQSATLRHLQLEIRSGLPQFTFPRMETLEIYKLSVEDRDRENDHDLGPISYTQLPKLKELEVRHCNIFANLDYLPSLFPSDAKPRELRLWLPMLEDHIFLRSKGVFDGLTKLEIPVASHLTNFWKDLTTLEELTLHPKTAKPFENELPRDRVEWIDEIITGLFLCHSEATWVIPDNKIRAFEQRYEKMETKKSLALLTRLRVLRLRHRGRPFYIFGPKLLLSDICCKVVLIKMQNLKCIDFCGRHPSSLGASKKVLDEMGEKMDLCFGKERDRNWDY